MSDSSRRGFLIMAGAGAAAVGTVAVAPEALATTTAPRHSVSAPLVAYVTDLRRGTVSVMKGEREVIIHDKALAARLARALR